MVYAVVACLSDRPPQAGIVSKRQDESSWFSSRKLPSICPTLCYMEIWVSPKIKVLPCLRKFVVNSGLGKFRHGKSIALSTKLVVVVVDGRACWRHLYDIRGVVAVYYKSINCNPLTPSLRFVVDLLYNLFLYSWQDFDWHSASRGPSALAELLVYELVSHLNLTRRIVIHSGDKCENVTIRYEMLF